MRSKGFSLIELLAVIVILAIISLIATPIILGIINETKEKAVITSTENYIDAIELAIMHEIMNGNIKNADGNYVIEKSGKQIKSGNNVININYDGSKFKDGIVEIKNQKVESLYANIDNLYSSFNNGNIELFNEKAILIEGPTFNTIIKNFVNYSNEMTYDDEDNLIKKIEFLSFGQLPENYTIEKLKELKSVDVSENENKSILAYYDEKSQTIFIYSENKIIFNSMSAYMFGYFTAVETINFGDFIDTSEVTDMYLMFGSCSSLTNLDLNKWNTGKVKQMANMFANCSNLTRLDLSSFDTGQATNMGYMFHYMTQLEYLDLSSFDTSNVENMGSMFAGCSNLTELNLNNFSTNKVQNMRKMFHNMRHLTSLNLTSFDMDSVTNSILMFGDTFQLSKIKVSNHWNLDHITDKTDMFLNCGSSTSLGECQIVIE